MYWIKKQITSGNLAGFTFIDETNEPMIPGRMYSSQAPRGCRFIVLFCRRAA